MSEYQPFQNPIDPDKITDQPSLIPYAHHVGSAIIKPEDQGKTKGRALTAMEHQTDLQLSQIYEQMQLLAGQVKKLEDRKRISLFIYKADMRFEPLINHTYHLYQKNSGEFLLSLVSKDQWGRSGQHLTFIASVLLLADHTWDILSMNPDINLDDFVI